MKNLILITTMLFFAATSVMAQTPAEKQASDSRIEKLKTLTCKDCGISEIDQVAAKCKSVSDATVSISAATSALSGNIDPAKLADLSKQVQKSVSELGEIGKMMGSASNALKELKNPIKIKAATKQFGYSQDVVKIAGEELTYQGKLIADMMNKK